MTMKNERAPLDGEGRKQKRFAGREPLAELGPHDQTICYSLERISDAVVESALRGGLTREKAVEVMAALPKATSSASRTR